METWRKIKDCPRYEVSDEGRVKNSKTGRVLKQGVHRQGYSLVWLCGENGRHGKAVHRLVAEAFIDNLNSKPQVNHKDGNKSNNCVRNLEWSTGSENTIHAYQTGLFNGKPKVSIRIVETGETFESIRDCAEHIGGSSGDICACAHGKLKSYKNLHFELI